VLGDSVGDGWRWLDVEIVLVVPHVETMTPQNIDECAAEVDICMAVADEDPRTAMYWPISDSWTPLHKRICSTFVSSLEQPQN
jgi:hypothetical protein